MGNGVREKRCLQIHWRLFSVKGKGHFKQNLYEARVFSVATLCKYAALVVIEKMNIRASCILKQRNVMKVKSETI